MDAPLVCGLRQDGRKPHEIRRLGLELGVVECADGSALFTQGNTQVLAFVLGPRQAPKDKSRINVFFSAARFSSIGERRRVVQGDKRSSEFEASACKVFERVVMMEQLQGSQVDIYAHVQQDDGSLESVALNAMSMALMDAGVPLRDLLVSCSSGFYDSVAFVDLNQQEANHSQMLSEYKVAIMPRSGRIAYISYDDAGGHKLSTDIVRTVTQTAAQGCATVHSFISQMLLSA
mmetsp:Transcript_1773/g.3829  ORF Transcript_1773/g.3829 Transcript_1773/m.3829 type:complete len:233 (-) Transcript_1773:5460-6158(-)